jgi:hypothetical protein
MKDRIFWTGPHGDEFNLTILGYKFPDAEDGYEANWLTLRVNAKNRFGSWSREVSCWLTWEILWVTTYLVEVIKGNTKSVTYSGLECDLGFVFIADTLDTYEFAVKLTAGLGQSDDYDRVSVLYLSMSPAEHQSAIRYLQECSTRFPPRGVRGQKGLQLPGPALL